MKCLLKITRTESKNTKNTNKYINEKVLEKKKREKKSSKSGDTNWKTSQAWNELLMKLKEPKILNFQPRMQK